MPYANPDSLVSTDWLADHMDTPDVRVVDATWFMPGSGRDAREEYAKAHIPGAVFFDIDEISDVDSDLPHMLPSQNRFSTMVSERGLGDGNRIVIYDRQGLFSAGRVWWTFRAFGHEDVAILDGGFAKWVAEGRAQDDTPAIDRARHSSARLDHTLVCDLPHVMANIESQRKQVIDARSKGRFDGTESEPREDLKSGHIPGSLNLPYGALSNPETGTVKSAEDLKALFEGAGLDLSKPVITTCGSGITASALAFGLHLLGHKDVSVYDGSWAQWGSHPDTPVETA